MRKPPYPQHPHVHPYPVGPSWPRAIAKATLEVVAGALAIAISISILVTLLWALGWPGVILGILLGLVVGRAWDLRDWQ